MSASLRFQRADESLEGRAGELLDETPMAGPVRLATLRPAGLYASLRAEGRRRDVLVALAGPRGEVVAVGVRNEKECHLDGAAAPETVGALSALRVKDGHRRGLVLGRGYRFLRELHYRGRARFYLTTVLSGNREALRLLSSGRAGLPAYDDWGEIRTCLMDPRRTSGRLAAPRAGRLRVETMRARDADAVIALLRRQGPSRQFFPFYEASDFLSEEGLLPGLSPKDVLLAWDGPELTGCVGVWDQSSFKSWRVAGYGLPLRPLRGLANLWSAWRGLPAWPRPGGALPLRFVAAFCARRDDPSVTSLLLDAALRRAAAAGASALAWSLHERDPLLALAGRLPSAAVKSRLFLVHWPEEGTALPSRGLTPYVETGAL